MAATFIWGNDIAIGYETLKTIGTKEHMSGKNQNSPEEAEVCAHPAKLDIETSVVVPTILPLC